MNGIDASYIQGYANSITGIINNILVPVLISVAFVVFLWGVYKYFIKGAASDTERASGRVFALYGIIGFVVLFSVWGIVQIFIGTLGLNSATNAPPMPTIGGSGGTTGGGTRPGGSGGTYTGGGGGTYTGGNTGGGTSGGAYPISTNPDGSCPTGYTIASLGGWCIASSNTGGGTGTTQNGAYCSSSSECSSGYCDLYLETCAAQSSGTGTGTTQNGAYCSSSSECSSGSCDLYNNMCTSPNGGSYGGQTGGDGSWTAPCGGNNAACQAGLVCNNGLCSGDGNPASYCGSTNDLPCQNGYVCDILNYPNMCVTDNSSTNNTNDYTGAPGTTCNDSAAINYTQEGTCQYYDPYGGN